MDPDFSEVRGWAACPSAAKGANNAISSNTFNDFIASPTILDARKRLFDQALEYRVAEPHYQARAIIEQTGPHCGRGVRSLAILRRNPTHEVGGLFISNLMTSVLFAWSVSLRAQLARVARGVKQRSGLYG